MMMNILNISTFDDKGAGGYAVDLNRLFNESGFHSRLIVRYGSGKDPTVIPLDTIGESYTWPWLKKKVKRWYQKRRNGVKRKKISTHFDYYFFQDEKDEYFHAKQILSQLAFKPDIIFLFWISEFITSKTIRDLHALTGARIYWMMMDNSPITGGCHYPWTCTGYRHGCAVCPAIRDPRYSDEASGNMGIKQKLLPVDLTFAAFSDQDYRRARSSLLCSTRNAVRLLAFVDEEKFKPGDREAAKSYFHIPSGRKVIFFGAARMNEKRKGMLLLMNCFIQMKHFIEEKQITILSAGSGIPEVDGIPVLQAGYLKEEELILAYQAADVFVCPSLEDSGPIMINQAVMCGTPVVATAAGVASDLVLTGQTGYLARPGDAEDLAGGLRTVLSLDEESYRAMTENCVKTGVERYGRASTIKTLMCLLRNKVDDVTVC